MLRTRLGRVGLGLVLASFAACGDDEETSCTTVEQNTWVQQTLLEWYLEDDQLPALDPAAFGSPSEILGAMTADVDLSPDPDIDASDRFSRVSPVADEVANIDSTFSGLGVLFEVVEDPVAGLVFRFFDVYGTLPNDPPSPASRAGLARGDAVEAIDGEPIGDLVDPAVVNGRKFIFGYEVGETHELLVRKADGRRLTLSLTAEALSRTSVPLFRVFDQGDDRVGYVFFRDFDYPAVEGLRAAVSTFAEQGVTKVVVDQRYNLGGFVFVIDYFARLLMGREFPEGEVVIRAERWNEGKAEEFDRSFLFEAPACPDFGGDLDRFDCQGPATGLRGLQQIVFINGQNTASASEVLLNSMRSHVDVRVVGSRSVGKPVGSAPFPSFAGEGDAFCGLVFRPITFRNVNADGEGEFYDGVVPDCPADDDPTRPIGDPEEASLLAALQVIETNTCPTQRDGRGLTAEPVVRRPPRDAEFSFSYENSLARILAER